MSEVMQTALKTLRESDLSQPAKGELEDIVNSGDATTINTILGAEGGKVAETCLGFWERRCKNGTPSFFPLLTSA